MAIAARTVALIELTLRPGAGSPASEVVTALNNASLNTTLSQDTLGKLKRHVGNAAGDEIYAMLRAGSKTNVTGALGQDAYLRNALFAWLKDRDAANDVFTQIATVV